MTMRIFKSYLLLSEWIIVKHFRKLHIHYQWMRCNFKMDRTGLVQNVSNHFEFIQVPVCITSI